MNARRPLPATPQLSRRRRLAAVIAVAAAAVIVGACGEITELAGLDAPPTVPVATDDTSQTTTPSTTTPSTTTPSTTTPSTVTPSTTEPPAPNSPAPDTPDAPAPDAPDPDAPDAPAPDAPAPDATLKRGAESPAVAELQQKLSDLGFYVPDIDGNYGGITEQAVLAFQKAAGLSRDGVAGPATRAALAAAEPIGPREGGDHVEVDLARQLMFVVKGDTTYIFNTSTGAPGMETPPGRFTVDREIDGMRHAPLGQLWRPKYFNAGIALHGANSIPGHAASHGCARLHNAVIDMIWEQDLVPLGTPVWVY